MPKHIHFHTCGDSFAAITAKLEALMATVEELNAKVDAITTNLNEQADEVGRIVAVIQEIRDQLAAGVTPEQLEALGARLDGVVTQSQAVEDSLRSTT